MPTTTRRPRVLTRLAAALAATALVATTAPTQASATTETVLTATWPKASAVALGAAPVITGTVTGTPGRVVQLQHQTAFGWQALTQVEADPATGEFSLQVPTTWVTKHVLRVEAPTINEFATATSVDTKTLKVKPSYRPRGNPSHHEDSGYRFDPCRDITYRVNPDRMPKGAMKDLRKAIAMTSEATGLTFVYDGKTDLVPWKTRNGWPQPLNDYKLAIGWATPRQVKMLSGNVAGLGGPSDAGGTLRRPLIEEAQVVFDSTHRIHGGFGETFTRGELMLHEIGHAVGLLHAFKPYQVMGYSTLAKDRFGAGDLAGLRKVGRSAGCWPAEDPAERRGAAADGPLLPHVH